jgi:hypothetical protein
VLQLPDALAVSLIIGAAAAFVLGEQALTDAADLRAIYWLTVGVVCVRAATLVSRPGAKA